MPIRILTDSTSDILPQEARERGIEVMPLQVAFGEELYRENVDLSHQAFFEKLSAAKELPKTSQLTPQEFLPYFEGAREAGDSLICLPLAGALSGTTQSARIAKEICGYDKIYILDTQQAVVGLRILVDLACLLRDQGLSAPEIAGELEGAKTRIRLYAMLDTLEYLHKGGRLSASVAMVGTLLKVKPLVSLIEGEVTVVGKGMGVKKGMESMMKLMGETLNADPRLPVYFGYTQSGEICGQFQALAQERYGLPRTETHSVGASIGTHVGPGGTVVAYLERA